MNNYFSHDSNARNSEKLLLLRSRYGAEGYGIYFMLLERLREESDYTSVRDYNILAFDLRVDAAKVKAVVESFGLFAFTEDGKRFYSEGFSRRMQIKDAKSEKARESARKKWADKRSQEPDLCERNANAMRTQSERNAIKGKESKVKESKNNSLSLSLSRSKEEEAAEAAAEKERILEIFFFEKNCVNPIAEARRFYAHYEANGWCRNGSTVPIKDRMALAKGWKPENPNKRADPTALRWLRRVYDKIKEQAPECASGILRGVKGMTLHDSVASGGIAELLITTDDRATANNIAVAHNKWPELQVAGWNVKFQII